MLLVKGDAIRWETVRKLENGKVNSKYYEPLAVLMSYSNLWDGLHKGLHIINKTVYVEFDYKMEVVSFAIVGRVFDTIRKSISDYINYVFELYTNDSIGVIVTDESYCEPESKSFKKYTFHYSIRAAKVSRYREREEIIKRIYSLITGKNVNNDSVDIANALRAATIKDNETELSKWVESVKQDKILKPYIEKLIAKGYLDNDLNPRRLWREIKKEVNRMKKYGVCAICGREFKRVRKNQFFCGKNENGAKCKMRFYYLLELAKGLEYKTRGELKQQLIDIYSHKNRKKDGIHNWDVVVDEIIKRLEKQKSHKSHNLKG